VGFRLFQSELEDASLAESIFVAEVSNEEAIDVDDVDDAIVAAVV
jgi:hypothetical protein